MAKNIFLLLFVLLFVSCGNLSDKQEIREVNSLGISDSLWTNADDVQLDSLLQYAETEPQDTKLAMLYYQIAEKYEDSDFEKATEYYQKMSSLCEQLKWNEGYYMSSIGLAHILIRQGEIDTAIVINLQAMEIAKKEQNKLWIGKLAVNIGNAYLTKQWYDMALTNYMEALPIFEKIDDKERLAVVYYQLSCLYSDIDAIQKAIEFGEKALKLTPDDPYSLFGLAKVYSSDQQYQKATKYLTDALNLCKLQNNVYLMGIIYYHLSENAIIVSDLKNAEKYAILAMEINGEIGNPAAYGGALSVLSKVEELRGNLAKAEVYINEVLGIMDEVGNLQGKSFCYMILSELAIAQQKYVDNIEYWRAWELVNNQIASETAVRTAGEMEAKYENEKKQLEIERQQIIIDKQKLQRKLFVGGIGACVVILSIFGFMLQLRTRRNYVLAELNATKDKLFSIISHDLKNPAIAQRDTLLLLVKNAHLWDINTLSEYHNELLKSAEGEVELLFNLLSWAQTQTGRITYNPETFLLSTLLPNLSLIQKMAQNKNVTLNIQIPENAIVTADRNMMATVVRNLLTNAVKYTAQHGTVTLNVTPSKSDRDSFNSTPSRYIISVADTGVGMSEKLLRNLFRIESAHSDLGTAGEQGSGLGLIVCQELLEKHKSVLHVESQEGKGSRFWFEIGLI